MPISILPLRRSTQKSAPLPVVMSGVRAGERVLQIGVDDPAIAGAIAARPGINGRSAFLVADERAAGQARKIAEEAMALADVVVAAPPARMPFDEAEFDLVVVHGRGRGFGALDAATLLGLLREVHRTLRPGGRVMVMGQGTAVGLKALLRPARPALADTETALQQAGYRPVRVLADREGYLFTEGLKPQA
jgi:SAM-dependent methyltransferase